VSANRFLTLAVHSAAMRTITQIGATVAVLAAFALTGCSSAAPTGTGGEVASLQSPAAGQITSAAPSEERPLIPVDDASADWAALYAPYSKCLQEAGVPMDGGASGKPKVDRNDAKYRASFAKCASKEPEYWIDREERTNPEYADYLRKAVKCLKARGFKAELGTDPPKIVYPDRGESVRAIDDRDACLKEAFADRLKMYEGE
jgi:hypothetical protein